MRVLLDHCVPKPFGRELIGHEVRTAFQMGWADLSNGKLLAKAAEQFDAFITVDQNLRYQKNLSALPLPVFVLVVSENDPATLRPYAKFVLDALANLHGNPLLRIHGDGKIE